MMLAALLTILPAQSDVAMQKLVDEFFSKNKAVGIAVAVVKGGSVSFHAEKGFADRERQQGVKPSTLFRLGSVSKPVAATGVMKLVEKGSLNLDEDIHRYIPELPASHPKTTLRQLLSHTAGIHHYNNKTEPPSTKYFATSEGALAYFIKDPLIGRPGEKYSYSTHAYTFVTRAMENAAGTSYTDFMRKNVFAGTTVDCEVLSESKPERSQLYEIAADGSVKLERVREDNSWKFGGGGLEATATGLADWGSKLVGQKIVTLQSLMQMGSPTKLNDGKVSQYGLGWALDLPKGEVSHNGAQQGARSALLINIQTGTVVAVLCNTGGSYSPTQLARALMDVTKQ